MLQDITGRTGVIDPAPGVQLTDTSFIGARMTVTANGRSYFPTISLADGTVGRLHRDNLSLDDRQAG